jgi:hypothetical protein
LQVGSSLEGAMSMEKSEKVLLIALLIFAISFFLPAIWMPHITPHTQTGYWCAYFTLVSPWGADGLKELSSAPVEYFAILLSGWINPLFLITMLISRRERTRKLSRILRTVVICLFPACWVVFAMEHVSPYIAYFIWKAAMVAALYSGSFSASGNQQARTTSGGA